MVETTTDNQEKHWDEYLSWCRANETMPRLSDFFVWCEDNDIV